MMKRDYFFEFSTCDGVSFSDERMLYDDREALMYICLSIPNNQLVESVIFHHFENHVDVKVKLKKT